MLLMSLGEISVRLPMNGIPSSTIRGSLDAERERCPRILICIEEPGRDEVCTICTPAMRPSSALETSVAGIALRVSPPTEAIEPVTSERRAVP